jgi:pyruvate formate lyase activating enzyme
MLNIGGLTRCTTIDYPGELAAVIFCQGCPWRCGYCHNHGLLQERSGHEIPWRATLDFLERRRGLLDAIVFSGGEPTQQAGLAGAMRAAKQMGFLIGLHTSGAFPNALEQVLPFTDWVGMDIKAPFEEYERITGVPDSGTVALKSAELLLASGVRHQFRTTLDPWLLRKDRLERLQTMVAGQWGEALVLQPVSQCSEPSGTL